MRRCHADRDWDRLGRCAERGHRRVIFRQNHPSGPGGPVGLHRHGRAQRQHHRCAISITLFWRIRVFRLGAAEVVLGGESYARCLVCCKTPYGYSVAFRSSTMTPPRTRAAATNRCARTTVCSRPATIGVSRTKTVRSRASLATSSASLPRLCCCAAAPSSTASTPIVTGSPASLVAAMPGVRSWSASSVPNRAPCRRGAPVPPDRLSAEPADLR